MTPPATGATGEGLALSRIAAGTMRLPEWRLSSRQLLDFISALADLGVTTLDLADIYGDYQVEAALGAALKLHPGLRQRIELVTKCGIKLVSAARPSHSIKHYDSGRKHIIASVEQSLKALHTDCLDLLLIHRPDPLMNAEEVAGAFDVLYSEGKVRHFGVSNFLPHQVNLLQSRLQVPLACNQVEFSPAQLAPLDNGTLDQCQQARMTPMIWSPLGGGRVLADDQSEFAALRSVLKDICRSYPGSSADQIVLAWILRHPANPVPVLGSGKLDRYRAAMGAIDIELAIEDWFRIYRAASGRDVP